MADGATTQAYRTLESLIVTLKLSPGSATTEKELIGIVGLGRTPVREAILRLAWEGLLEVRPRAGLRVAPLRPEDWMRVIEARRGVEALLARNAAASAAAGHREIMSSASGEMAQALEDEDVEAFLRADKTVDEAVAQLAGNPFAARVAAPLQAHSRRFWFNFREPDGLRQSARCHLRLSKAVLDGREAAAAAAVEELMDLLAGQAHNALTHI